MSGQYLRLACQIFLLATSLIALVLCPHSKVEESFNLQAAHDLYYVGVLPAVESFNDVDPAASCSESELSYDHTKYPGGERCPFPTFGILMPFSRAHHSGFFYPQLCRGLSLEHLFSPQSPVSSRW